MDAEATLKLAKHMGLVPPTTEQAMNKIASWRTMLDSGKITLEEYTELVKRMKDEINAIPSSRQIVIRVRGEIDNSAREAASFTGQGRNAYIGHSASNRAVGGPVTGGTPYIVGEVGPELFVPNTSGSIVPHNQLAGSTVVNFYYSPAISLTDRTEAETRLVPIIRKALVRA